MLVYSYDSLGLVVQVCVVDYSTTQCIVYSVHVSIHVLSVYFQRALSVVLYDSAMISS